MFFVDNIFRFTQAGSEVSALLGRIPSAVGYQPTLATDMGALVVVVPTVDTVEEAQRAKYEYVCRKLQLRPGDRVIEAGCAWGALALYMAERYGVTVIGVKSPGKPFTYATGQTVVSDHDLIIASGTNADIERFAALDR